MMSRNSLLLEVPIQQLRRRIRIDDTDPADVRAVRNLDLRAGLIGHMREADEVARKNQSDRASKSRPKMHRTRRNEVVAAMRRWRAENHTLKDFLDAAAAGSIDGIAIEPANRRGIERYTVECDCVSDDGPPVAYRTLAEWWAHAGSSTAA